MFIKKPENAPAFVIGRMGVNPADFVTFLHEHTKANGWCDFDLLNGDKGPYLVLNQYVPKPKDAPNTSSGPGIDFPKDDINPDDIPF